MLAVQIYAPLPSRCLADLVRRLRFAVPQWQGELKDALQRAKQRLANAHINGVDWYWPSQENAARCTVPDTVRLLTPFDPVVWDRERFEIFWGWQYIFRGLCSRSQTPAWLLCATPALAGPGDWMGQPSRKRRATKLRVRLRSASTA